MSAVPLHWRDIFDLRVTMFMVVPISEAGHPSPSLIKTIETFGITRVVF